MAIWKKFLMSGVVVAIAVIYLATRGTSGPSLAFKIVRMDFSQRRPVAFIALSNDGKRAVKWGYDGCWIELQTPTGVVTNDLHFGGILETGAQAVLPIQLPNETGQWRIACTAREASTLQRAGFMLGRHWDGKIRQMGRRFLPNRQGISGVIHSPLFDAENSIQAATNNEPAVKDSDLRKITDIGF